MTIQDLHARYKKLMAWSDNCYKYAKKMRILVRDDVWCNLHIPGARIWLVQRCRVLRAVYAGANCWYGTHASVGQSHR